jgi:hypothetical protein
MFTSSSHQKSSNEISKITTAVQFLDDVSGKKYEKSAIRRYLIEKRHLTNSQVDEVFKIHKARGRAKAEANSANMSKPSEVEMSNSHERPERVIESNKDQNTGNLGLFTGSKKNSGQRLIDDFLRAEKIYCDVLECLWSDYYMKLSEMAFRQKFQMTQRKAEEMFKKIPQFLKFHTTFCKDLAGGADIGRMFVRLLHFFKNYPEYMKSLTLTIKELGTYAGDKPLQKCLNQIRKESKFKPYDLVGLMLIPLDRIIEYKVFLQNLTAVADKSHSSFEYLSKGARRIGRIALYIEKYRSVIHNMHEMYRVQVYHLAGQVNVFADKRRLIRRGMIIRRTEGWPARNKQYVFFLFNDILLWTTKKGIFQNVVPLDKCELLPWESRNNSDKKFKVVAREERIKILYLECGSQRQKADWYNSIEKAILDVHKVLDEEPVELPAVMKYEDSDEEEKATDPSVLHNNVVVKRMSHENISLRDLSTNNFNAMIENKDEGKRADGESDDFGYDYEVSQNYSTYEFKGFDPFSDTASQISESQISESDYRFYEENSRYQKIRDGATTGSMSPFRRNSTSRRSPSSYKVQKNEGGIAHETAKNSRSLMISKASSIDREKFINKTDLDVPPSIPESPPLVRRSSSIIRRSDRSLLEKRVDSPIGSPSVTLSLSNLET